MYAGGNRCVLNAWLVTVIWFGTCAEMVVAPHEAVRQLTRNKVDYLPIERAEGRIATTLMLVYPPGIGTIVPGERIGARAKPMKFHLPCSKTPFAWLKVLNPSSP